MMRPRLYDWHFSKIYDVKFLSSIYETKSSKLSRTSASNSLEEPA